MKVPTVTIKVTPHELQVMDDALRLYAHVVRYWNTPSLEEEPRNVLVGIHVPMTLPVARVAQRLHHEIGLHARKEVT